MKVIPYGRQTISQDDVDAVCASLQDDYLTTGPKVQEFEGKLAEYCGAKFAVSVSSGTAALHLASLVLLNEGDRVLTTPNSFIATSNAILYAKAKPVFVDIDTSGNIDLDICEQMLMQDSSIKAIYGVAFSGNMLNQDKLRYLKKTYNIVVLEDCAHALGATYDNIKAGSCTHSDCSIFSFHPVKHITTLEGGAITTNSKAVYDKLLLLRNHGMVKDTSMKPWEYEMVALGFNYRLTDVQCALGISQLNRVDEFIEARRQIAKRYDDRFAHTIIKPLYAFNHNSSYHLYGVQVDFNALGHTREDLFIAMKKENINLQVHYLPINKQRYYCNLGYGSEPTPEMNQYYEQCLSLPIFPKLSKEKQTYIQHHILQYLTR